MMKCGHAPSGLNSAGEPVCTICIGLTIDASIPVGSPDLEGRVAKCFDCDNTIDSDQKLAFYTYRPGEDFDGYYCGCRGWD